MFSLAAIINSNLFSHPKNKKQLSYQMLKCVFINFGTPCRYIFFLFASLLILTKRGVKCKQRTLSFDSQTERG